MFIDSTKYKNEVLALIDGSTHIDIAIAFWGQCADEVIRDAVDRGKTFRIICNLLSGGTNPEPIKALISYRNVKIKHLTTLHAKVIFGHDNTAIVGSANFSTDGLNHEAEETSGWDEAGFKTSDLGDLKEIKNWFNGLWKEAVKIEDADLAKAEEQWKQRRINRMNISGEDGLLNQPRAALLDKSAYVAAFKTWATKEAKDTFNDLKEDLKFEGKNKISTKKLDFFENFDEIPDDAPFIAVYFGKIAVNVRGPFERISSLDTEFLYSDGSKGTLQIVRKINQILGVSFDSPTKKDIEDHLKTYKDEFISELEKKEGSGLVITWADVFATDKKTVNETAN